MTSTLSTRLRLFFGWAGRSLLGSLLGLATLPVAAIVVYVPLLPMTHLAGGCGAGPDCRPLGFVASAIAASQDSLLPLVVVGLCSGGLQGRLFGRHGARWRNALAVVAGMCIARGLYAGHALLLHQLTSEYPPVPVWGTLVAVVGGGWAVGQGQSWLRWGRGQVGADKRSATAWVLISTAAWLAGGATATGLAAVSDLHAADPFAPAWLFLSGASVVAVLTGAGWAWLSAQPAPAKATSARLGRTS